MLIDNYATKRLYRSRTDRKIAGVCGGLAERYVIDPTWIRILFVIFFIAGGSALLFYSIMWLIVPLAPQTTTLQR